MNYEQVSDFELNKAVARALGHELSAVKVDENDSSMISIKSIWCTGSYNPIPIPAYCNNPLDAWPIMTDNGISTINISGTTQWFACVDVRFETICMSPDGSDNGVSCFDARLNAYHTNPLRAAMIVFLMMKDAENE